MTPRGFEPPTPRFLLSSRDTLRLDSIVRVWCSNQAELRSHIGCLKNILLIFAQNGLFVRTVTRLSYGVIMVFIIFRSESMYFKYFYYLSFLLHCSFSSNLSKKVGEVNFLFTSSFLFSKRKTHELRSH